MSFSSQPSIFSGEGAVISGFPASTTTNVTWSGDGSVQPLLSWTYIVCVPALKPLNIPDVLLKSILSKL